MCSPNGYIECCCIFVDFVKGFELQIQHRTIQKLQNHQKWMCALFIESDIKARILRESIKNFV